MKAYEVLCSLRPLRFRSHKRYLYVRSDTFSETDTANVLYISVPGTLTFRITHLSHPSCYYPYAPETSFVASVAASHFSWSRSSYRSDLCVMYRLACVWDLWCQAHRKSGSISLVPWHKYLPFVVDCINIPRWIVSLIHLTSAQNPTYSYKTGVLRGLGPLQTHGWRS